MGGLSVLRPDTFQFFPAATGKNVSFFGFFLVRYSFFRFWFFLLFLLVLAILVAIVRPVYFIAHYLTDMRQFGRAVVAAWKFVALGVHGVPEFGVVFQKLVHVAVADCVDDQFVDNFNLPSNVLFGITGSH